MPCISTSPFYPSGERSELEKSLIFPTSASKIDAKASAEWRLKWENILEQMVFVVKPM